MQTSLLPALTRVLSSVDALRNLRALYALMATFCLGGLMLASAQAALLRDQTLSGTAWLAAALVVTVLGVNATGLMLMDQARGQPVRDPQDALADALHATPRVLLALAACVLLGSAVVAGLAALLWATRWPGVGPALLAVVLPLTVVLLGSLALVVAVLVGPLTGPAVWAGQSSRTVLAFLRTQLRRNLPETALLMGGVYLLTALTTAAVSFIVLSGARLTAGLAILGAGVELPAAQLLAGVLGLGPRAMAASGAAPDGSLGTAALAGGGVVFALALVLPTLVWLRGCCAVYLALNPPAGDAP